MKSIKGVDECPDSPQRRHRPQMGSFLGLTRVLSLCLLVSAAVAGSGGYGGSGGYQTKCQQPKVRREWRALSDSEQAEFIRAVNVRIILRPPRCSKC